MAQDAIVLKFEIFSRYISIEQLLKKDGIVGKTALRSIGFFYTPCILWTLQENKRQASTVQWMSFSKILWKRLSKSRLERAQKNMSNAKRRFS
jgi:hypothetical protein